MAACAHVWHYKCVSRLIHTPDYPIFQCPNCRAYTDLSAEVDDSNDFVEEEEEQKNDASEAQPTAAEQQSRSESQSPAPNATPSPAQDTPTPPENTSAAGSPGNELPVEARLAVNIENMHLHDSDTPVQSTPSADPPASAPTSNPDGVPHSASVDIPGSQSTSPSPGTLRNRPAQLRSDAPGRGDMSDENPLTPRNDTGPLAFDGWTGIP